MPDVARGILKIELKQKAYNLFSLCHPQGYPWVSSLKLSPFDSDVWPAIANIQMNASLQIYFSIRPCKTRGNELYLKVIFFLKFKLKILNLFKLFVKVKFAVMIIYLIIFIYNDYIILWSNPSAQIPGVTWIATKKIGPDRFSRFEWHLLDTIKQTYINMVLIDHNNILTITGEKIQYFSVFVYILLLLSFNSFKF